MEADVVIARRRGVVREHLELEQILSRCCSEWRSSYADDEYDQRARVTHTERSSPTLEANLQPYSGRTWDRRMKVKFLDGLQLIAQA